MIVALTGSTGFLGRTVGQAVLAAGHTLVAVARPGPAPAAHPWRGDARAQVRVASLNDPIALTQALAGCDVVVHAAAALQGDEATQWAVTVEGTRQLIAAMQSAGVGRLVGISSLSVYDYLALADGDTLDETAALEREPAGRDVYARCKLQQDELFRSFARLPGCQSVTLRPGVIVDAQRMWNFSLGQALGPKAWLALGPQGAAAELPLVHVDDVAAAVLLALVPGPADGLALNLVGQPAPTRGALLLSLQQQDRRAGGPTPWVIRFPWGLHRLLAGLADGLNCRLFGGRLPLPGLLRPARLMARFRPLHYTASLAERRLGWRAQVPLR